MKITKSPETSQVGRSKTPTKKVKIRCKVDQINTDPTSYKGYDPILSPINLFVDVEVEVTDFEKVPDGVVLNLGGFTSLLSTVATAIDVMHIDRQSHVQALYNKGK